MTYKFLGEYSGFQLGYDFANEVKYNYYAIFGSEKFNYISIPVKSSWTIDEYLKKQVKA